MSVFDFLESHLEDAAHEIGGRILGDEGESILDNVFGGGESGEGGGGDEGIWGAARGLFGGGDSGSDSGDSSPFGGLGGLIDRFAGGGSGEGIWSGVSSQLGRFLPDDVSGLADRVLGESGSWAGQLVDTASKYVPEGWGSVANAALGSDMGEGGIDALVQRGMNALAGGGDGDITDRIMDLGRSAISGLEPSDMLNQSGWQSAAENLVQRGSSLLGEGELLDSLSDVVPTIAGQAHPQATMQHDDLVGGDRFDAMPAAAPTEHGEPDAGYAPRHDLDDQFDAPEAPDAPDAPQPADQPEYDSQLPDDQPMDDFSYDIAQADQVEDEMVDDLFEGL